MAAGFDAALCSFRLLECQTKTMWQNRAEQKPCGASHFPKKKKGGSVSGDMGVVKAALALEDLKVQEPPKPNWFSLKFRSVAFHNLLVGSGQVRQRC